MIAANNTPPPDDGRNDSNKADKPAKVPAPGRDAKGYFIKGNKLAKGNTALKHVHELRKALYAAVKPKDISEVIKMLVGKAKAGDVVAAKELLDRMLGKATQPIETDGPGAIAAIQIVYAEDWYGSKAANLAATDAASAASFAER